MTPNKANSKTSDDTTGLRLNCKCSWKECREVRDAFFKAEDKLQRWNVYQVTLADKKEESKSKKTLYKVNLGIENNAFDQSINQHGRLVVARLHFDPKSIELFEKDKMAKRYPMPAKEYNKYCSVIDPRAEVHPTKGKHKGKKCYHFIPNYSRESIQNDLVNLVGLNSPEPSRAKRRQLSSEKRSASIAKEETIKTVAFEERKRKHEREKDQKELDEYAAMSPGEIRDMARQLKRQKLAAQEAEAHSTKEISLLKETINQTNEVLHDRSALVSNLEQQVTEEKENQARTATRLNKRINDVKNKLKKKERENKRLRDRLDSKELEFDSVLQIVDELCRHYSGLSRLTIFSDEWHSQNKDAANHLFGFRTWVETKEYCLCLFPDLEKSYISPRKILVEKAWSAKKSKVKMTKFEHCLIAKMFIHSFPIRTRLAKVFGISGSQVGRIISEWVPRWGKAGEQLSVLIIDEHYLRKECPKEYEFLSEEKVAALLDGKDFRLHYKRNDTKKQRSMISSKIKDSAGRCITWTTPAGLCFEYTKLFGGRISEQELVRLWGSLGTAFASVIDWKDWVRQNDGDYAAAIKNGRSMETALTGPNGENKVDTAVLRDCVKKELQAKKKSTDCQNNAAGPLTDNSDEEAVPWPSSEVSISDDDEASWSEEGFDGNDDGSVILEFVTPTSNEAHGDAHSVDGPQNQEDVFLDDKKDEIERRLKKSTERFQALFDKHKEETTMRLAANKLKEELEKDGKKTHYVDTFEQFTAEAKAALKSGPQSSPLELVLQLECHERLYRKFGTTLSSCLLSDYLEYTKEIRWQLLDWLGSAYTPESYKGKTNQPPKVPLRLNKIPVGWQVLGDKGFDGTDRDHPNMNPVRTPLLLRTREVKQYLRSEIFGKEGNKQLCRLRYSSEVAFARATRADGLKDVISYKNIYLLQHMHAWGHAEMNLANRIRSDKNL